MVAFTLLTANNLQAQQDSTRDYLRTQERATRYDNIPLLTLPMLLLAMSLAGEA